MLALERARARAFEPIKVGKVSKLHRDSRAELQSITDPEGPGAMRLPNDVASVLLRARYRDSGTAARLFQCVSHPRVDRSTDSPDRRDFLPQLIYNNPHVRFGNQYLYSLSSRLRHNYAQELKAHEADSRIPALQDQLKALERERLQRREKQARLMGLNDREMEVRHRSYPCRASSIEGGRTDRRGHRGRRARGQARQGPGCH